MDSFYSYSRKILQLTRRGKNSQRNIAVSLHMNKDLKALLISSSFSSISVPTGKQTNTSFLSFSSIQFLIHKVWLSFYLWNWLYFCSHKDSDSFIWDKTNLSILSSFIHRIFFVLNLEGGNHEWGEKKDDRDKSIKQDQIIRIKKTPEKKYISLPLPNTYWQSFIWHRKIVQLYNFRR